MKQQELSTARERSLRKAIVADYLADESAHVRRLSRQAKLLPKQEAQVRDQARQMIERLRKQKPRLDSLDAFLHEYDLSTTEGTVMMCLAEALLRVPDTATRDQLIQDSLQRADWHSHLGHSDSLVVDAATWALLMSGRVMRASESVNPFASTLKKLLTRSGEPVIRESLLQAMRVVGGHFVSGESIEKALSHAKAEQLRGYQHSFDMLGEAALTMTDAKRYEKAYRHAIKTIGKNGPFASPVAAPGISIKLSALYPRFNALQAEHAQQALVPLLLKLAQLAKAANIGLTVDAEEAERLDLTLDIFGAVYRDSSLAGWDGFGIAVQAYQKRASAVIDWLAALAADRGRRIPVRLVKGAYWDSEIKRCQTLALDGYSVFTRKLHTDVSYIACVKQLFKAGDAFYPQFATHNAHSLAVVRLLAPANAEYECQRLHGMGEGLYDPLVAQGMACRVYAPVGSHQHLLAYLVRRLLENGANTSFINRLRDKRVPLSSLAADPVALARDKKYLPHPHIPLPRQLYSDRPNAPGIDLSLHHSQQTLNDAISRLKPGLARPLSGDWQPEENAATVVVTSPTYPQLPIGRVIVATKAEAELALRNATQAQARWNALGVNERAELLERAAERLTLFQNKFTALIVREAGKPWPAAVAEVREAINLCHYYAAQARSSLAPHTLHGPTGERNILTTRGRGPTLCISPWNFPLAIFMGQVAAALVAGNTVIAKPAQRTSLVAFEATRLLHKAGIPRSVLHFLPGSGAKLLKPLINDARVQNVLFTGSFDVAKTLQRQLTARPGAIIPLIAETGGQNAMLVDSTALPEQVVSDVLSSAFDSAGQRCSALRLLCLQEDIADDIEAMLAGAMANLRVGDPAQFDTDVGPLIDAQAKADCQRQLRRLRGKKARLIAETPIPAAHRGGAFLAPRAYAIESLDQLQGELFGPVLHVLRYPSDGFEQMLSDINSLGYGLTAGLHSRITARHELFQQQMQPGNLYINRDLIGAVPGVQPFGGSGLSGTGPKAGGPHYLLRLVHEQTISTNTAAMGGNASLLAQQEDD